VGCSAEQINNELPMAILCASQRHRPTAQKLILFITFPLTEQNVLFNSTKNMKTRQELPRFVMINDEASIRIFC
jgi:hypothetical protein